MSGMIFFNVLLDISSGPELALALSDLFMLRRSDVVILEKVNSG